MSRLPGDPNLPPGCSNAEIERRFGDHRQSENHCPECGDDFTDDDEPSKHEGLCDTCYFACPQCGTEVDHDTKVCPECKEAVK